MGDHALTRGRLADLISGLILSLFGVAMLFAAFGLEHVAGRVMFGAMGLAIVVVAGLPTLLLAVWPDGIDFGPVHIRRRQKT